MNTNSIGVRPFGEYQSKAMRAYTQSGQYHTIVESRVRITEITSPFVVTTQIHCQQILSDLISYVIALTI